MNTRERHIIPPSGSGSRVLGTTPTGAGSATLSPTSGWAKLRSAQKQLVAQRHKSVVFGIASLALSTKDHVLTSVRTTKALFLKVFADAHTKASRSLAFAQERHLWCPTGGTAPFGASATLSTGPQVTQTTSALYTKALLMKFVRCAHTRTYKIRTGFAQRRLL